MNLNKVQVGLRMRSLNIHTLYADEGMGLEASIADEGLVDVP